MKYFLLLLTVVIGNFGFAQTQISLKEIMKGKDFIGHYPENFFWSIDGKNIYFGWNPKNEPGTSVYQYQTDSKNISKTTSANYLTQNNELQDKTNYRISDGNLVRFNEKNGTIEPVYTSSGYLRNLQIGNDNKLYFQKGKSLFEFNTETKSIVEKVQFSKGNSSSKNEKTILEKEEMDLFEYHQNNEQKSEWEKTQPKSDEIPTIHYSSDEVSHLQMSPCGNYVFYRLDFYAKTENTSVSHHITKDGHTYEQKARAKVHDNDHNHQLWIYSNEQDSSYQVDFSSLPDIKISPKYLGNEPLDKARNITIHRLVFSPDGKNSVVDIRSYDNKDRWIVSILPESHSFQVLNHQKDEAWIGGPGISSWNNATANLGWIDNSTIYFQSEKTGFSHLYTYNITSKNTTALTAGNWEVRSAKLSEDKKKFYLVTNESHPGNHQFYHLDIASKKRTLILGKEGMYRVKVSPDEKHLAFLFSSKNQPWELYICENKKKNSPIQITQSTSEAFEKFDWYEPKIISFQTEVNTSTYARIYEPEASKRNGAAVIFVHGAGYLQNAHNGWSGYYREYMFHNLLREKGFTVLDIDYRASDGYGRNHRTSIYRHMGGDDLKDQLLGRELLIDSLGIDPNRIGIYGGSYGGFITLMALLTEPGKFKCGAALRSVTDWLHYNHEYTSNILNYPSTDIEAYRKSSPIYFAENLQDRLLMLHGMVDDNVQFQDVVRLSQRFIELEKENWELSVFPVEAHGFKTASSWHDEYRRILELFEEELLK